MGSPPNILVSVNGDAISESDLQRELKLQAPSDAASLKQIVPDPSTDPARAQALDELIDQALMLQEAARLGISVSSEELENQLELARAGTPMKEFQEALQVRGLSYGDWSERVRRRALCDEVVRREIRSSIVVSQQDLRDYYWEHITEFRRTESVKLRQIFCGSRSDIHKALAELQLGEPFAEVAERYSKGPEADQGGDLGWIQKKVLPKKLEKFAFALKKGKYSDVIVSDYGWHILYAEDKRPAISFTLEESSPEILEALLREREQPLYRDWLAGLRGKADIKHFDSVKEKS
jgi:peptidyl-prolyl cis-trans isomerase SurA